MGGKAQATLEERHAILEAWAAHGNIAAVMRATGHGRLRVKRILAEQGIAVPNPSAGGKDRFLARKQEIVQRYEAGEPAYLLADELGVSTSSLLYAWLPEIGVDPRDKGESMQLPLDLSPIEHPKSRQDAWLHGYLSQRAYVTGDMVSIYFCPGDSALAPFVCDLLRWKGTLRPNGGGLQTSFAGGERAKAFQRAGLGVPVASRTLRTEWPDDHALCYAAGILDATGEPWWHERLARRVISMPRQARLEEVLAKASLVANIEPEFARPGYLLLWPRGQEWQRIAGLDVPGGRFRRRWTHLPEEHNA